MLLFSPLAIWLSCSILILNVITLVQAQAVDEDKIDLAIMPDYIDQDNCLKCWLRDCWYGLAYIAQCETNACLCRPGKMGGVIPVLSKSVLDACKDLDDASMAVSFYTAYCSTKGHTSLPVSPTILQPTGAFTETTTATVTVAVTTVTVFVSSSAGHHHVLQPWSQGPLGVTILVGAIMLLV